jgi:hypothetical protein
MDEHVTFAAYGATVVILTPTALVLNRKGSTRRTPALTRVMLWVRGKYTPLTKQNTASPKIQEYELGIAVH